MGAKAPTPKAFAIGRCEQTAYSYSYACSYSWSLLLLIFYRDPLTPGDKTTSHTDNRWILGWCLRAAIEVRRGRQGRSKFEA